MPAFMQTPKLVCNAKSTFRRSPGWDNIVLSTGIKHGLRTATE